MLTRLDQFAQVEGLYFAERRHNTMLADLLAGLFGNSHCSNTHRLIRNSSAYGSSFIDLLESEMSAILNACFPLWREYEAREISLLFESPSSVLIRITDMFNGIRQDTLLSGNKDDQSMLFRNRAIYSMDWILDMSRVPKNDYTNFELDVLGQNGITWQFLLEEAIRICSEPDLNRHLIDESVLVSFILSRLDIAEIRLRQREAGYINGQIVNEVGFDVFLNAMADIIMPIVYVNYELVNSLKQMMMRAVAQQQNVNSSYFAVTQFEWLNHSFVVNVGVFTHDVRYPNA